MTSNSQSIIPATDDTHEKESLATPLHGSVWHRKGRNSLTLSFSTEDRTGLVFKIAEMAAKHKVHIVRNHGARVDDVATSTLILEGSESALKQFEDDFNHLKEVEGTVRGDVLHLPVKQIDVHFVSKDRRKLLRDVSKIFASRGINMVQLEGFVHIERSASLKPGAEMARSDETSWAVFFVRIELLKSHLAQIKEVETDLLKLAGREGFVQLKDHVFQGFEQRNRGGSEPIVPRQGGHSECDRDRFYAFFDAMTHN